MVLGDHLFPGNHPLGFFAGQDDLAGLVLHPFEQNLDLVARLGRGFIFPLVERDEPFGLVANVDDHLIAHDFDDLAGDDAANVEVLAFFEVAIELVGTIPGE